MSKHGTMVVAMSGGVDSSVAAALMMEAGYDCVGITMKTWAFERVGGNPKGERGCCSLDAIHDARSVCNRLGIPHYVLDFAGAFDEAVIDDFVSEYLRGRTPNPCVVCNTKIKWDLLIEKTKALDAIGVATGHYARVRHDAATGRHILSRGRDLAKDQSYVLWGLTQDALSQTHYPLAELTKPEVRAIARELGLKTAEHKESQEICFIPDDDYARLIRHRVPGLAEKLAGGQVVTETGEVVGEHDGYPFYTVGQRRGLGISLGYPIYVTEIDANTNTLTVGRDEALSSNALIAEGVNLIKWDEIPASGADATVKIRYRDAGVAATLHPTAEPGTARVDFSQPRRAVAPGQSVVFYDGDDVVGGGRIRRVLSNEETAA